LSAKVVSVAHVFTLLAASATALLTLNKPCVSPQQSPAIVAATAIAKIATWGGRPSSSAWSAAKLAAARDGSQDRCGGSSRRDHRGYGREPALASVARSLPNSLASPPQKPESFLASSRFFERLSDLLAQPLELLGADVDRRLGFVDLAGLRVDHQSQHAFFWTERRGRRAEAGRRALVIGDVEIGADIGASVTQCC
jgi:hypothetical protein